MGRVGRTQASSGESLKGTLLPAAVLVASWPPLGEKLCSPVCSLHSLHRHRVQQQINRPRMESLQTLSPIKLKVFKSFLVDEKAKANPSLV